MRKIEQQMIAAIRAGVTDKTMGNTRVHACVGFMEVQLHGNIIAHVDLSRGSVRFTLAGWPTPTTRSRINAILSEFVHVYAVIYQREGRQYAWTPEFSDKGAGKPIGAREWVQA